MKVLFTSDLHFTHRSIVQYTNRGVDTTQEDHDEWLIDLWNKQVDKDTIVYNLGDYVFNARKFEKFEAIDKRLNGKKILVRGNHDNRKVFDKSGHEWYDLKGFNIDGHHFVMCHFPLAIWDKRHHGAWHLHGHSHGGYVIDHGNILDVGLDSAYNILGEHKFFTLDEIRQYMSERKFVQLDHHDERTQQ